MLTIALCICCLGIGACIGFVVAGICWGASGPNKMDEGTTHICTKRQPSASPRQHINRFHYSQFHD